MGKRQPSISFSPAEKLAYVALLVAAQVVLGNLVQIPLAAKQFNLGFLPVAVAGALFGPVAGAVVGGLGDFLGAHLFPAGAYFFGFTLTYILVGLAYGLALHGRPVRLVWAVLAGVLAAVCNLLLNSYWLTFIIPGRLYGALLAARAPVYLLETPISIAIVFLVLHLLARTKLPFASALRAPQASTAAALHEEKEKES